MRTEDRYKKGFMRTGSASWEKQPKNRSELCARLKELTAQGNKEANYTLSAEQWNQEAEDAKPGSEKQKGLIFCAEIVI